MPKEKEWIGRNVGFTSQKIQRRNPKNINDNHFYLFFSFLQLFDFVFLSTLKKRKKKYQINLQQRITLSTLFFKNKYVPRCHTRSLGIEKQWVKVKTRKNSLPLSRWWPSIADEYSARVVSFRLCRWGPSVAKIRSRRMLGQENVGWIGRNMCLVVSIIFSMALSNHR